MRSAFALALLVACGSSPRVTRPAGPGNGPVEDSRVEPREAVAPPVDPPPPPPPPPPPSRPAPKYAEPVPVAQRVAIRPLSARDGVLPFSFFDRSAGVCATIGLYRLEGVGVADGAPRWSTTAWAYAIGELPDGSVVAVADALAGSGQVQVGVLGRVDGAVRFTCAAPAGIGTLAYNWSAVEGGLRADLSVPAVITGTEMPADAAMAFHEVLLTVSKTGCALSRPAGDPGTPWRLPTSWTVGATTVTDSRAVGAVGPSLPDGDALVARRGGRELWRRPLPVELSAPCAIP